MYGIGQRVVHPMHGAGVIENVTEELLYGAARTYYVFRQAVSGLVLKLPTDNCEAIGVRLLYDRERMDAVLSAIPSLTVEEERNWNRRYRENMARLKSGDLTEVARVVKSLMRRGDCPPEREKCCTVPRRYCCRSWRWCGRSDTKRRSVCWMAR